MSRLRGRNASVDLMPVGVDFGLTGAIAALDGTEVVFGARMATRVEVIQDCEGDAKQTKDSRSKSKCSVSC